MLDFIISGCKVIDGTGREPFVADVGVSGDTISAVGDLSSAASCARINAAGCCLCPGFIDVHSHSDTFLMSEPTASSKVYQGVTTEVVGNCGASAAPIGEWSELPFDWQKIEYPGRWRTMAEYLALLEKTRTATNVIALVGHNRLRINVMGYSSRPASPEELRQMKLLLEESLDAGAWGISTGLIYRPGKFAPAAEIVELAGVVARRNGIYATHMRSEKSRVREAVAETIDLACKTEVRAQISHIKTAGSGNWRFADEVIALIDRARNSGIRVAADRYPYVFSCTDLDILLPDWLTANNREGILAGIRDRATRARLRGDLSADRSDCYWDGIIVATSCRPEWRGRPVRAIAGAMNVEPAEAVLRVLDADQLQTQAFFAGMSEQNMWKFYAQGFVMAGSDAAVRPPPGVFPDDHPHPRAFGTFPRFLRAALDGKTVSLHEAVFKMTGLGASHFGIPRRGTIVPGNYADVVVFDPAEVRDMATYETPARLARGMKLVMVNGQVVLDSNGLTGRRPGKVLAPPR